ncbi:E3 ubiquitin-protein ligase bre1-like protein 1-like protein, partial [Trifolium pratense]
SSSTVQDVFLSRLLQTGATENSSSNHFANEMEQHREMTAEKVKSILNNILTSSNNFHCLKDGFHTALLQKLREDVSCGQMLSNDLELEISCGQMLSNDLELESKNLRLALSELHLKHKSLASDFRIQRDLDAKNKAELKRLKGELEGTVAELEEINHNLATLKVEKDAAKGAILPVLAVGNTHIPNDKIKDKQKDLQDMESTLKELLDRASTRLVELKRLHEERISYRSRIAARGGQLCIWDLACNHELVPGTDSQYFCDLHGQHCDLGHNCGLYVRTLNLWQYCCSKVSTLPASTVPLFGTIDTLVKNLKCITSSHAFQLVRDQIEKSKSEVQEYQALYEKLQAEKDNLAWKEREWYIKNDLADLFQRSVTVSDLRVADIRTEIQKAIEQRNVIENRLKEEAREPGRKEIIAEFKSLLSSFPDEMGSMQSQLTKYKESASDLHSLHANVHSISSILDQKVKECDALSVRSADQLAEINRLHVVVQDLRVTEDEMKLILQMYRHETIDSRDVMEAREAEYRAWAHVQSLKSSLDEHNLELRVKTAIESEARSQQKLAAAEAEIAEMRHKLDDSKREMGKLSNVLRSKNEENEAYLSEIETIGQAYDDMQTQNQHLLHQITERDDYNIKLVLEGVRARQKTDSLIMEKQLMEQEIQQSNVSLNLYDTKAARIEDQLRFCSDQIQKLKDNKHQSSVGLENAQRRLSDIRPSSQQVRDTVVEVQSKITSSRVTCMELEVELDKERFDKKKVEEDLEVAKRNLSRLKAQDEDSSVTDKLQQELGEYREIVKCSICRDKTKEVVITKCYHLFCNSCIQKVAGSRQRKCPQCGACFGANDVKPVYL